METQTNIYYLIDDYIANLIVFNMKLKNIHWNLIGREFLVLHDYAEKLLDRFQESVDDFAEIVRMQKGPILGSLSEYVKMSDIKDLQKAHPGSDDSINVVKALDVLAKDLNILKDKAKHLRGAADVDANYTLAALLDDELLFLEKHIWFVASMSS